MIILSIMIPIIAAFLYQLIFKIGEGGVSVPLSDHGDGVLYYGQIKSFTEGFSLKGYYGFNESHALLGGLSAWPPMVYLVYSMLGGILGWNVKVILYFNLLLWSIAFIIYVKVLNPKWSQFIWFTSFWVGMAFIHYFNFQCVAEAPVELVSFLYAIFVIRFFREESKVNRYLVLSIICLMMVTMMRGYNILVVIPLICICISKKSSKAIILVIIGSIVSALGFVLELRYFTSPYFWFNFNFEWLMAFKDGIAVGLKSTVEQFYVAYSEFVPLLFECLHRRLMWPCTYIVLIIAIMWVLVKTVREKNFLMLSICLTLVGFILAVWMCYDVGNGGRQFLCLAIIVYLLVSLYDKNAIFKICLLTLTIYMTWFSQDKYSGELLADDEKFNHEIYRLENYFENEKDNSSEWDYTIDWAYAVQEIYGIPGDYGLNACRRDFLNENYKNLKAKYIIIGEEMDEDVANWEIDWEYIDTFYTAKLYKIR